MDWFNELQHRFVKWFNLLYFCMVLLFAFGVFLDERHYFDTANFFMKIYLSLYLIYRFNSYQKSLQFTHLDKIMCYSAGMYLLGATFADYFISFDKLFTQLRQTGCASFGSSTVCV